MKDTYHTVQVDMSNANQRFDRFLRKFYKPYTTVTLTMIYSWIRKGYIRINDKKGSEDKKVLLGDVISINITQTIPLSKGNKIKATGDIAQAEHSMILKHIIHEDDYWLVFNKPPHMLMHPGSGSSQKAVTMNDWLYTHLNHGRREDGQEMITKGSMFKPAFGYRLDKDTSGVLIAAKTYDALQSLNEEIRERNVTKRYVVVTQGALPRSLSINKPLFKGFHGEKGRAHMFVNYEKGLPSKTHIYSIAHIQKDKIGTLSLGLVRIMTGRMHQIRVHAASEGFPVLGDKDYGTESVTRIAHKEYGVSRQLLHSFTYSFHDGFNKKAQQFIAPLPDDIKKLFPDIREKHITDLIKTHLASGE